VNHLAEQYSVTTRAIYKDWKNRKAWLQGLLEVQDPGTFFLDILSNHREIDKLAMLEYAKADNSNARIGALNLRRKINRDFAEMMIWKELVPRLEQLEEKVEKVNTF